MTYLVTGGTGTFGRAMVQKILRDGSTEDRITVLSRDEDKQYSMKHEVEDDRVSYFIADVRNKDSMRDAFQGVDYVFHAAAMKHVPACESNPAEAVAVNVNGTMNVINLSVEYKIKKVVYLSTDKAVDPSSVMGMTKRIGEMYAIGKAAVGYDTSICVTRFGNIAMSRGSVIPLFIKQIKAGRPVTLTNGSMRRFIMNIDAALELVQYAFDEGENGCTYVKKAHAFYMGNVARAVLETISNTGIFVVGNRPGERRDEILLSKEERVNATDLGCYYSINNFKQRPGEGQEYSTATVQPETYISTKAFIEDCIRGNEL